MIISLFYFKGNGEIREIIYGECKQTLAIFGEENAILLEPAIGVLYYRYSEGLYNDLINRKYKVVDSKLALIEQQIDELEQI